MHATCFQSIFRWSPPHEPFRPDQADQLPQVIITQNGEAKAVIQDIDSFEEMQDTIALLRILALGSREIEAGQVQPAAEVIARLRERRARG
ncbi:MAG: type II toxin-antitoxin system prevent-host-death family antitoxin [Spirochaetaceae bacterium]|nr:type II toxin-antitoxin system prevent-host-death family antitoxin [Spirochaetaceae bacterium]